MKKVPQYPIVMFLYLNMTETFTLEEALELIQLKAPNLLPENDGRNTLLTTLREHAMVVKKGGGKGNVSRYKLSSLPERFPRDQLVRPLRREEWIPVVRSILQETGEITFGFMLCSIVALARYCGQVEDDKQYGYDASAMSLSYRQQSLSWAVSELMKTGEVRMREEGSGDDKQQFLSLTPAGP